MIKVSSREDFLKELNKIIPKRSTCVEIGVLYGDFSKQILDIIEPVLLTLVDPYKSSDKTYGEAMNWLSTAYSDQKDYNNIVIRFYNEISDGQVDLVRMFSYEAASLFHNNTLDFFYLDASHLKEDAKRDLEQWLPKLKANGIAAGHDYIEFDSFGVKEAVNEFMEQYGFEMIIFNEVGGDWALQKSHVLVDEFNHASYE